MWPFSTAELTAGLRRYFAEPKLQIKALGEMPLSGPATHDRVRGLKVDYTVGGTPLSVRCVVKEPRGGRAGLAGTGRREAGVYQSLAGQLPMATPALVAADLAGSWLVLEALETASAPAAWTAVEYRHAVQALAGLHERFWGLADDLAAFPWLARPLSSDFEIHVYAAAQAVEQMMRDDWPRLITRSQRYISALGLIISQVETIVQPLREAPHTLLHGDFWPGNILPPQDEDDDLVVLDWQEASLGPGILDLVTLVNTSHWELGKLPLSDAEIIRLYRDEMQLRAGQRLTDDEWALLWDHALLWRFVQAMFDWLARAPRETYAAREAQFVALWLNPALAAVERRLRPVIYF